jgi:hypothetical protein
LFYESERDGGIEGLRDRVRRKAVEGAMDNDE